jgi:hypothetical protein
VYVLVTVLLLVTVIRRSSYAWYDRVTVGTVVVTVMVEQYVHVPAFFVVGLLYAVGAVPAATVTNRLARARQSRMCACMVIG